MKHEAIDRQAPASNVHRRKTKMAKRIALSSAADWVELRADDQDWKSASPTLLGTMLAQLYLIRGFEEAVLELAGEGLVHGPAHSSVGQEGGAVGSIVLLNANDHVNGSHRGHHQFLAKALQYVAPDGIDPKAEFSAPAREVLHRTLAEILGLSPRSWLARAMKSKLAHRLPLCLMRVTRVFLSLFRRMRTRKMPRLGSRRHPATRTRLRPESLPVLSPGVLRKTLA